MLADMQMPNRSMENQHTVNAVEPMRIDKITNLSGKSLPGRHVPCHFWKLLASTRASDRDECLDMRVLALELSKCCKAALHAVDGLLQVPILVEQLYKCQSRSHRMGNSDSCAHPE